MRQHQPPVICFGGHLVGHGELLGDDYRYFALVPRDDGTSQCFTLRGIWPLSIKGLGRHTNLGSALLVMALSGSAFMPIIYNALL